MKPTTVEEILSLVQEQSGDAELYQQLGDLYFLSGEHKLAWEAFMQSLRLNPNDPWTCMKFGTLLTICDDKQYARKLFDHAIKLHPELAVAHWCSANLHRKQGEYESLSALTSGLCKSIRTTSRRGRSWPSGIRLSRNAKVRMLRKLRPNQARHLMGTICSCLG